jgi:multifunctional beta-oxidation protein
LADKAYISDVLSHRILEVLDKGKQTAVTAVVYTKDKKTGDIIFENQSTVVLRGTGGFGGKKQGRGTHY